MTPTLMMSGIVRAASITRRTSVTTAVSSKGSCARKLHVKLADHFDVRIFLSTTLPSISCAMRSHSLAVEAAAGELADDHLNVVADALAEEEAEALLVEVES